MAEAEDILGPEGSTVLPPRERWLVTIVVIGAMAMVILDTTIANVAIPHMQASLGATAESVAWVLTSYIVATAIAIPITGWLADRIGRKLLFTIAIVGFTASSALCGVAQSLTMMIGSRVLQGTFGAFIGPLCQATMYDIFPRDKHPQAMIVWGMALMLAPVMGPVLGGYLTEQYDWRWVFYINVPIGIVTSIAIFVMLPDFRGQRRPFDFFGFAMLAVALASLQLMLDRGTQLDWFDSIEIWVEAALTAGALWMFVIHTVSRPDAIVRREIFADRNFLTAMIFSTVISAVMMAGAALVAPMLQRLMAYPVMHAGLATGPRGIGTAAAFLLAGRLVKKVDARLMVFTGMVITAWSLHMMTRFTLDMPDALVMISGLVQGFGFGLVMMPITLLAFVTLPATLRTEASSFYNLMRNVAGSVSIAVMSALLAGNIQTNHAEIGERLTTPVLQTGIFESLGIDSTSIAAIADAEVNRQAAMIAYLDDFWLMMWMALLAAPLVLLMRPPKEASEPVHMSE